MDNQSYMESRDQARSANKHSKQRRRGELCFKANFESGNLSKVHVVQEGTEYELYIRPDSNSPQHRLWFYFCVQNVRKNQRVLISICNFSKTRSLYRQGMTPLVRSTSRPQWQRIPEKQVFYYRSPKHQRGYVLSFLFTFDREDDDYYFAYCYPYTYTDLQRFLHCLDAKRFPYYRREVLGRTVQNRRLDLLTITDPSNLVPPSSEASSSSGDGSSLKQSSSTASSSVGKRLSRASITASNASGRSTSPSSTKTGKGALNSNKIPASSSSTEAQSGQTTATTAKKRIIFITARVHPGETPASFVCHGVISFLLSDNPVAKQLRQDFIFKIVPMINPDGVFLGNYRCSAMGYDLNRQYLRPEPWAHPEICAINNFLQVLKDDPTVDVDFYIDIHSHSTAHSGFMYVNHHEDPVMRDEMLLFPRLLDYRAKEFSFNGTKCCRDPSKMGTGRRALGEVYSFAKHCYTLEVSFFHYVDSTNTKAMPFQESNYLDLGKNLCLTLADFYEIQHQHQQALQQQQQKNGMATKKVGRLLHYASTAALQSLSSQS